MEVRTEFSADVGPGHMIVEHAMKVASDFGINSSMLRKCSTLIRAQWKLDNFDAVPEDADVMEKLTAQVLAQSVKLSQLSTSLSHLKTEFTGFRTDMSSSLQRMGDLLLDLVRETKVQSGSTPPRRRKRERSASSSPAIASASPSSPIKKPRLLSTTVAPAKTLSTMPDYASMSPIVLKGALASFGLKGSKTDKAKPRMVQQLTDIWKAMYKTSK